MIDEIEKFGEKLKKFGENYKFQNLIDYGSEIMIFAQNFEIDKLSEKFKMFSTLIEQLKSA
jgi:hypothetical protein